MPGGRLVCPHCATEHGRDARLCAECGTPLVLPPEERRLPDVRDLARERARKVRSEFAEGTLVRVAGGRHQAEAEFLSGLLLEEGIPSLIRRSAGFDVPDFLAAGPRDILVPESGAEAAREVLLQVGLAPTTGTAAAPRAGAVLLTLLIGVTLIAALLLLTGAG